MKRLVALLELFVVLVCGVGAWLSWRHGVRATWFPPAEGLPGFESTSYSGGWILGAAILAAMALLAAGDSVRRLVIPSGGMMES